jgi:murein DD-endopeptidase MepM/ murein hydrolase activator NlpD
MVVRQPLQPLRIEPITLKPTASRLEVAPSRTLRQTLALYLPLSLTHWSANAGDWRWLRRETELPRWSLALCVIATLLLSASMPIYLWSQRAPAEPVQSAAAAAIAPAIVTPDAVRFAAPASSSDPSLGVQANGLSSATQDLLKQIQQTQHDNATLRAQLQQQEQDLSAAQSSAAATDAERNDQIRQLQSQMSAELQSAGDQIAKLKASVDTLDQQANDLRKRVGMDATTYPAITLPNLATAADPAQAVDAALASVETHVAAVTSDLQTVKSTAEKQIAYAQSIGSTRPSMDSDISSIHGNGQLSWPTTGTITQPYGPTSLTLEPSYEGFAHFHLGLDIANVQGTPILAAAAGTGIFAGWSDAGYGTMVEIDHGNGLVTLYGHMVATPLVTVGQHVTGGQQIGNMGSTGNSTGNHTHFAVMKNGSWDDPLKYLP